MMPIIVARGIGRVGISIFWHPRELLLLINSYLRGEWLPMAMLSVGSKVTADQNNGLLHAFPPPPWQPPLGSWGSRIRPLKTCAIRTIAVVMACIVASAPMRSSTKNLRQIASSRGAQPGESKKSECPTLRAGRILWKRD
jgi:hypothetical protein